MRKKAKPAEKRGRPKGATKFGEPLKQTGFRLPVSMIERIDLYVEVMRKRDPGRGAMRVDAVRELLDKALSTWERSSRRK